MTECLQVWSMWPQVRSESNAWWEWVYNLITQSYVIRMLCISWKMADPQTTKMKSPNNQGPTGNFSSSCFNDLGTFPLLATFLLCFSLASRIFCLGAMIPGLSCDYPTLCLPLYLFLWPSTHTLCPRVCLPGCIAGCVGWYREGGDKFANAMIEN